MRFLTLVALFGLVCGSGAWAEPTQPSATEAELAELQKFVNVGREALPVYLEILKLQKELLKEVPGPDGQIRDYSQGLSGLRAFSKEVKLRTQRAREGSESDVRWLHEVVLPRAQRVLDSGAAEDLLQLRDLLEKL